MALLFACGFESGAAPAAAAHAAEGGPSGAGALTISGTAPTIQTASPRSGTYFVRSAANAESRNRFSFTRVNNRTYWFGCAIRVSASPTSNVNVLANSSCGFRLNTSRQLELRNSTTTLFTSSELTVDTWYFIEFLSRVNTAGTDDLEGWIDGVSMGQSFAVEASAALTNNWDAGPQTAYGAAVNIDIDDVYLTDDQGSAPCNTRLGPIKIVTSLPTSDTSRDAGWTDNDNTTTNLFTSVDNRPPVGVLPATGAGTADLMIKNAASTTTDNVVFAAQSAITAGVDNRDAILATQLMCSHALDVATSTTLCSQQIVANDGHPGTSESNFDANAIGGTWPTNWIVGRIITENPDVTDRTVSPSIEIGKRTAATRIVAVSQARIDWIYLDSKSLLWNPPVPVVYAQL